MSDGRVGKADQALAVPATPLRVDGPSGFDPSRMADRIAEIMWIEFCPGIRLTGADVRHYRKIGKIALLRMRGATAAMCEAGPYIDEINPVLPPITPSQADACWTAMIDAELAIACGETEGLDPKDGSARRKREASLAQKENGNG
jgi:hypothetical protein